MCLPVLSAQTVYPNFDFAAGDTVAVCREQEWVYPKPGRSRGYMGPLLLGNQVIILQKTSVSADLDGRTHYWYKVAFGKQYEQSGYIFGASLAIAHVTTTDGTPFLLTFRPGELAGQPGHVEVQPVRKGVGLSGTAYSLLLTADDTVLTRVDDNRGYPDCQNVVVFTFLNKTCPDHRRDFVFLWNGQRSKSLPLLKPAMVPAPRCYSLTFVFPNDPGGVPDQIKAKMQWPGAAPELVRLREAAHGSFYMAKD